MKAMILSGALAALLALATTANADSVTFDLNVHFGAVASSGPLKITFDDQGTPGTVLVTLDATGLDAALNEKVKEWYYSYSGDATTLTMGAPSDLSDIGGGPLATTLSPTQSQQADGDGKYNILHSFESSGGSRFQADEIVTFTWSKPGLVAGDFNVLAAAGGGNGPFYSAAHLLGTGTDGDGSDWLGAGGGGNGIPEPAALALMVLGIGAALLRGRRN